MPHSKSHTQSILAQVVSSQSSPLESFANDTGTMGSVSKSLPPIESSAMMPLAASNCSISHHQKQSSSSSSQYRHYQGSHISKNFKKPHHSTQSESQCYPHHHPLRRLHHRSDNLLVHFIRSSTSFHLQQIFSLSIIVVVIVISSAMFTPVKGLEQVRVVALNVPSQVRKGSEVELSCFYDLGNASLYSLKWFYRANDTDLDEQEFFRYTPTIEPHKQFFPLEGVLEHVNVNKSKGGRVVIMDASGRTTGNYKCEISVEGTFQTVAAEKLMTVLGNGAQSIRTLIGLERWNGWQRIVWIGLLMLISCSWYHWLFDIHHPKSPLDHHLSIGSSLLAAASIGYSRTSNHPISNWGQTTPKSPASIQSPHQSIANLKLNLNILAQFTNNVICSITVFLLIFCTLLLLLGLDTKLLFIKNDINI